MKNHRELLTRIAEERKYTYITREEVVSGDTISSRPVFQQVLNYDMSSGRYNAVMVTEISRLGRGDMQDCGRIMNVLKENNIYIITPYKIYDINNPSDARQIRFELFLAREEYELTKERLLRGKEIVLSRGQSPVGISCTLGYESIRGKVRVIEEEVPIVKMVFEMRAKGESCQNIAEHLNKLGFKTKRGTIFHISTISRMIRNKVFIGYIKYNGKWIKSTHEPILDKKLFDLAYTYHKTREGSHDKKNNSQYYVPLYCALCGGRMSGDYHTLTTGKSLIYRCRNTNRIHEEYNFIYVDKIHPFIRGTVKRLFSNKILIEKHLAELNKGDKSESKNTELIIQSIEATLHKKKGFLTKCKNDYENGVLPAELYAENWNRVNGEVKELEQELYNLQIKLEEERKPDKIIKQHTEYISSIIHDWDNTEDRNRKMVLQMLFDKIEYNCITKEFTLYGAEYITNKN